MKYLTSWSPIFPVFVIRSHRCEEELGVIRLQLHRFLDVLYFGKGANGNTDRSIDGFWLPTFSELEYLLASVE